MAETCCRIIKEYEDIAVLFCIDRDSKSTCGRDGSAACHFATSSENLRILSITSLTPGCPVTAEKASSVETTHPSS